MKANNPNKKQRSKVSQQPDVVNDDRFKEVYSDPRFMNVPQKLQKLQIDDRFKKAFKSKEFNLV